MITKPQFDEWIKQIEAGNYKRYQDELRIDDNFNVLGLLANIIDPINWDEFDVKTDFVVYSWGNFNYYLPSVLMPISVQDEIWKAAKQVPHLLVGRLEELVYLGDIDVSNDN